ncbi:thiamine biosynthesis lipoprotein [Psychrobacter luti]|uniref:FAD:protein FMN transferase n=1 Tax=Psychrobacter luti TaxID=198481 RepID=A0A839TDY8_9GAMM|nr:FAD:protein FMN transferase [Psychrobacter luti]MBB3105793.1 thiamine biosynthesis lipoprotein [Psychrobacter luti]
MKANTNSSTPQLLTFILPAMGCQIQISLNITQLNLQQTPGNTDQEIVQEIDQKFASVKSYVKEKLLQCEHIFSRFDNTSELMILNRHTNQWTDISLELFTVLEIAIAFVPKTQGLVTPTLLNTLWDIGYKHSFGTLAKQPTPSVQTTQPTLQDTSDSSKNNIGNQSIKNIKLRTLAHGQHQVFLPTGTALDLNGYVKGWCAMQLAEYISQRSDWQFPCLIDMGGDIAIGVPNKQESTKPITWAIAIAKPYTADSQQLQDEENIAIIHISAGAVATSGQDYRRWWHKGHWQHHLIHPYHACPAKSDVLSATILADNTLTAEVYAKYCVILGAKKALQWLSEQHIAAVLVDTNHKVMASPAIHPNLIAI